MSPSVAPQPIVTSVRRIHLLSAHQETYCKEVPGADSTRSSSCKKTLASYLIVLRNPPPSQLADPLLSSTCHPLSSPLISSQTFLTSSHFLLPPLSLPLISSPTSSPTSSLTTCFHLVLPHQLSPLLSPSAPNPLPPSLSHLLLPPPSLTTFLFPISPFIPHPLPLSISVSNFPSYSGVTLTNSLWVTAMRASLNNNQCAMVEWLLDTGVGGANDVLDTVSGPTALYFARSYGMLVFIVKRLD